MSTNGSADRPAPASVRHARGRTTRTPRMAPGLFLVGIGFVGLIVPLLPTTDILILALPCFARSSVLRERWLLDHPRGEPPLCVWRAERAIPRRANIAACVEMTDDYAIFCLAARPGQIAAMPVGAAMIGSAAWIVTRPSPSMEA